MKRYADFFVLLAGILWGLVGPSVKSLRDTGFTSIEISAMRWVLSGTIMFIIVLILDKKLLKIHLRDIGWFICTGVLCIFLSSTLYFVAMPHSSVAVANILMYTSPIYVMIFAIVLFHEKITPKKIIVLFLSFFGCALATGIANPGSFAITPLGLLAGLGSGLFYGLYSIFGKAVLKKYDSITVTLYTVIFAAIGALFLIDVPKSASLIAGNTPAMGHLTALVVLMTIAPYTLYTIGLKRSTPTRASIISCIEPMTSALVGTFIMAEPFTVFQLIGIIMILSAGILLELK